MLDNVGIVHMNGRVYDPELGRFLSVDPVFQFPENTQSLNPYSYVLNNPLSLTDPTGYTPDDDANPNMMAEEELEDQTTGGKGSGKSVRITPTGSRISREVTATDNGDGTVSFGGQLAGPNGRTLIIGSTMIDATISNGANNYSAVSGTGIGGGAIDEEGAQSKVAVTQNEKGESSSSSTQSNNAQSNAEKGAAGNNDTNLDKAQKALDLLGAYYTSLQVLAEAARPAPTSNLAAFGKLATKAGPLPIIANTGIDTIRAVNGTGSAKKAAVGATAGGLGLVAGAMWWNPVGWFSGALSGTYLLYEMFAPGGVQGAMDRADAARSNQLDSFERERIRDMHRSFEQQNGFRLPGN